MKFSNFMNSLLTSLLPWIREKKERQKKTKERKKDKTVKKAWNGQIAFLCLGPLIQGNKLGTSRNEIGENF